MSRKGVNKAFLYFPLSIILVVGLYFFGLVGNSQITCDNLVPSNNNIDINLSDAELRTDQDFICNFNARICPIVFVDNDNDGIQDPTEDSLNNLSIRLTDPTESTVYDTLTTDSGDNSCFEPLAENTDYVVRVEVPPTPFSTTGGDSQSFSITTSSGIETASFGYSNGELLFTVPSSIVFPAQNTSNVAQTSSVTLSFAEVIDTRVGSPGFNVTAVVENFDGPSTPDLLTIANSFTSTPQTVNVINGSGNGVTPGASRTVTGTTDPFTLITASSGNGTGTYRIDDNFDMIVPPFTPADNYTGQIVFTVI